MSRFVAVLVGALAIVAGGAARDLPAPAPAHVVVIVFENKDASEINARSAPAMTALGLRYARLTNYFAITHPSLPNYLALVSGSNQGITDDCTTCSAAGESLGDQLTRDGRAWAAYAEGFPSGSRFVKRHVPFLYFQRAAGRVRSLSRFDPRHLPDFAFVVPDLCHDMHDCSVATGDSWLKRFVGPLLGLPETVIFVVFDEGSRGNHVAAFALGSAVRPHWVFTRRVDHYGLLATIEDLLGLPRLGAAKTARPITGVWN
jgi:phosphatidylinositol-3-phosphatase